MRVSAIVCSAQLIWRFPPRSRRCRTVRPEDAGIGAAPASRAKCASVGNRSAPAVWAFQSTVLVVEENTTFGMSRQRRANLPFSAFAPNQAWLQAALVAHDLTVWRQLLLFDGD